MLAFIIWLVVGAFFILFGMYTLFSKRTMPFAFWANAEVFAVDDVRAYNRALGILWIIFGAVFCLLGIPLLEGQNSPYIIISILGAMFECIAAMVVYTVGIERKYRKKQ